MTAHARTRCLVAAATFAMIVTCAYEANAQGFAVRAGANVNPDQLSVGGQYELGPLAQNFWLQPNADAGFGNDATLVAFNLDVVYRRPIGRRSQWTAFAGGGPAINYFRLPAYNQTETGVTVVGGLRHGNGAFSEVRVGFGESPAFRIGVGYAFGASQRAGGSKSKPSGGKSKRR